MMKIFKIVVFLTGSLAGSVSASIEDDYIIRAKYHSCEGFIRGTIAEFEKAPEKDKKLAVVYSKGEFNYLWVMVVSSVESRKVSIYYNVDSAQWHAFVPVKEETRKKYDEMMESLSKLSREEHEIKANDLLESRSVIGIIFIDRDKATRSEIIKKNDKEDPSWKAAEDLIHSFRELK